MEQFPVGAQAPDFTLTDTAGQAVRLSDYHDRQHVVLVFTRGFT
ncbi:MAG: redoxin domain-containing protein [Chloroflexi bacterium]|nr:redoxin domain-containing protein [Chloroflexota bacterium]